LPRHHQRRGRALLPPAIRYSRHNTGSAWTLRALTVWTYSRATSSAAIYCYIAPRRRGVHPTLHPFSPLTFAIPASCAVTRNTPFSSACRVTLPLFHRAFLCHRTVRGRLLSTCCSRRRFVSAAMPPDITAVLVWITDHLPPLVRAGTCGTVPATNVFADAPPFFRAAFNHVAAHRHKTDCLAPLDGHAH